MKYMTVGNPILHHLNGNSLPQYLLLGIFNPLTPKCAFYRPNLFSWRKELVTNS